MSGILPIEKMSSLDLSPDVQLTPAATQIFPRQMGYILRQSAVFFAGTIFTAAASYFFKIYLARALGAEALGIYALGMTIIGLLGIFSALGLPQSAVRFVATYTATARLDLLRGFVGRGVLLLCFSNLLLGGMVMVAGPWVAVHFYHTPALTHYLMLFSLIMVFGTLNTFLAQVLTGYKDVARRTVIANFIGGPLMMMLTLGFVAAGLGLWGYIFAQAASSVVVLLLLAIVVWKLTPRAAHSFREQWPPLDREVVSFSTTVFAMEFLGFLMSQTDKILIGYYLNARQVGIYVVAAALVTFVPIILQSVNQIFSPTIADLHARGQQEVLGRMFQTLTKWILGLTLPLGCVMVIFAPSLMRIFGPEFEVGWPILVIGTLAQLINCGVGSVGYLLLMSGHQRRLIKIQAVMAGVMIVLNLLLIPKWGITGAAIGAAFTTVISNVWFLREVHNALHLSPYNRGYGRLLAPLSGSICVVLLLRESMAQIYPQWIEIATGLVLAYLVFIVIALSAGLDDDDRLLTRALRLRLRGIFQDVEVNA